MEVSLIIWNRWEKCIDVFRKSNLRKVSISYKSACYKNHIVLSRNFGYLCPENLLSTTHICFDWRNIHFSQGYHSSNEPSRNMARHAALDEFPSQEVFRTQLRVARLTLLETNMFSYANVVGKMIYFSFRLGYVSFLSGTFYLFAWAFLKQMHQVHSKVGRGRFPHDSSNVPSQQMFVASVSCSWQQERKQVDPNRRAQLVWTQLCIWNCWCCCCCGGGGSEWDGAFVIRRPLSPCLFHQSCVSPCSNPITTALRNWFGHDLFECPVDRYWYCCLAKTTCWKILLHECEAHFTIQ